MSASSGLQCFVEPFWVCCYFASVICVSQRREQPGVDKSMELLQKAGIRWCSQAARLRISEAFECFKIPFEMGI